MKINKKFFVIIGLISGILQVGILLFALILPAIVINSTPISYDLCVEVVENLIDCIENDSTPSDYYKKIVIYNGTTIKKAIASNEDIDMKAIELTKNAHSDREKARSIYKWIGANIKYDDEKATAILSKDKKNKKFPESGAICAYNTKSGICFDKACLYIAMARSAGIKVKLISGEAYDGEQYVGHAWNQVYLREEDKWINVDSTFYDAGNYFDSDLFYQHRVNAVVGEW